MTVLMNNCGVHTASLLVFVFSVLTFLRRFSFISDKVLVLENAANPNTNAVTLKFTLVMSYRSILNVGVALSCSLQDMEVCYNPCSLLLVSDVIL